MASLFEQSSLGGVGQEAVQECAVIGAPDEKGLMKPYAFVLAKDDADRQSLGEELKELALSQLQAYKHPRQVLVLDEFPRTHLGKVDRGALKRRMAESH